MVHFSTDSTDISSCIGTGIGYKSIVILNICAQPKYQIFLIKILSFLKLVYQNENEIAGTSMAFTMIVFRFEKSHCLSLKS